jgi:hypothetical protein
MDDLDHAVYRVVHDYPGGARKLAPLVGMNAGTLSNKADPAMPGHQLTVRQAVAIQHATKDLSILRAEAQLLGCAVVPLSKFEGVSDLELLEAYAQWNAEIGETAAAIRDCVANRRITREAVRRVRREVYEDAAHGLAFLERLEALVDG